MKMNLTLCVDETADPAYASEFGLALILKYGKDTFLLDTGSGEALKQNLALLDPEGLAPQKVILSHGHYDHTGGLKDLAPREIWCGKDITADHYSLHADGEVHHIAMPEESLKVFLKSNVHSVETLTEIREGLFLSGPVPRVTSEDCGGNFFHDKECSIKDIVPEEISLLTEEGVLISGCCHAGLMNTILHWEKICPSLPVRTVAGGLHLRKASGERLAETAAFLQEHRIEKLVLMHCTGSGAITYLRDNLPGCSVVTMEVGESLEL